MNDSMKPIKKKPAGLTAIARRGESDQQAIARTLLSPSVHAGHMLAETHKGHPAVDINAFVAENSNRSPTPAR